MKNLLFTLILAIFLIGCSESPSKLQISGDSLIDSLTARYESKSTTFVITNLDTMYHYYNSRFSDLYITEVNFKNKKYTIMFTEITHFKIINVDTTNINPIFKPEN